LPEASYLRALVQAYAMAVQDFDHDTRSFFRDQEDLRAFHAGLIALFLHRTLAREGDPDVLALKEPHLAPLFPSLHALVPDSRFILTARDPRDTVASMVDVGQRMRRQGHAHFFQQRDMKQLAGHVKSFYAPVLNATDTGFRQRVLIVRYEHLVRNEPATVEALRTFTGLALDREPAPEPLPTPADPGGQPRYLPWYTEQNGRALNDASVGRYPDVLSGDEIAAVETHCGDLMQALGYA